MNLPKIAILLLRGLEGCGVTSYTRHLQSFFHENNAVCDVFVLNPEKKIGRPDTSQDVKFTKFNFADAQEIALNINSGYDGALIFSVPSTAIREEIANNYVDRILNEIKIKKIFVNHDHSHHSFRRNADYVNAINSCDKLLCHSLEKTKYGFINWLETKNLNKEVEKLDVFFHTPIIEHLINFDKSNRAKRIICAGRAASWKRTELAFRLHEFSRDKDFITEVIGYERSLNAFKKLNAFSELHDFWLEGPPLWEGDKYGHPRPSAAPSARRNEKIFEYLDRTGQSPNLIYSIGPYTYFSGLSRVSNSAYAIHARTFEHNGLDYGNNMEYQTLECCLLSIPIAHRHFLETVTIPETQIPLKATGNFVSIDDDNTTNVMGPKIIDPDLLVDRLEDIWHNSYSEMREANVNFIREHYSTYAMVPTMLQRCGF